MRPGTGGMKHVEGFVSLNFPERRLSICHVFEFGILWWAELLWEEVMGYVSHLKHFLPMLIGPETTPELSTSIGC